MCLLRAWATIKFVPLQEWHVKPLSFVICFVLFSFMVLKDKLLCLEELEEDNLITKFLVTTTPSSAHYTSYSLPFCFSLLWQIWQKCRFAETRCSRPTRYSRGRVLRRGYLQRWAVLLSAFSFQPCCQPCVLGVHRTSRPVPGMPSGCSGTRENIQIRQ